MPLDGEALGAELASVVREYVNAATSPLLTRIDRLEKELAARPVPPDLDKTALEARLKAAVLAEVPEPVIPEPADLTPLEERLSALEARAPEKGEKGDPGEPGRDGEPGPQGESGERGERGEKGDPGDRGEPGLIGERGEKGDPGQAGKDGVGLADALIDREGQLVLTMTDGRSKALGVVIGKDGAPGRDGERGSDGRDGLGFDDLDLVETEKGLVLRFVRGEDVKQFPLPVVIDRGVWREGQEYAKGAAVTWAGSVWIAQEDTAEKPDSGKAWRLAVKRGRDGRDGKAPPEKAPVKIGPKKE